jgi:hypothetical protein
MHSGREEPNSPYVYRDEQEQPAALDPEGRDIVIADGLAMSFRSYRR